MANRQKLELTWVGKEERPKLEPRILIEDPDKSYGDKSSENMLIHGDNLLALKALEQDFAGKIKCIYIDPPYNTGSAFEHYDDGIAHSLWLTLMYDRLELLRRLLAQEGTIWINLDDNEMHYCKVLCDEVFGRQNFLGNVIWEKSDSPRMDAEFLSSRHDHLLVFTKDRTLTSWNRVLVDEDSTPEHYDRVDYSGRKYYLKPLRAMGGQGDSRNARPTLYYPLAAPDGSEVYPKRQDGTDGAWRWNRQKVEQERSRIDWVNGRNGWIPYYRIYADQNTGRPPETIWPHIEVGSNRTSKAEIKALFPDSVPFGTPKPEKLLQRVITVTTNPGDWILDSFAGSGTTGAVAHKMGRRWIMVELGEHANTHCLPRLKKVVDGKDGLPLSEKLGWKGGGGFKFYKLAPSLLRKDKFGNWVIDEKYNANMLAAAMCKHEGFTFHPEPEVYWKQGRSTENDYIFVTTSFITVAQVDKIHEEMKTNESLLICTAAFAPGCKNRHANITLKKIPQMVLSKCEFGKDNYNLHIIDLPREKDEEGDVVSEIEVGEAPRARRNSKRSKQKELFGR